jgi:uncharacterized protein YceK
MRLLLVSIVALSLLLAGCGQVFVGFVSNPGNPMHVSGTVSMVQLEFYDDSHGTLINFTAVTFINAGTATTINFCGDQRRGFPINQPAQASFTTGTVCSTLISVSIN